MTTPTASLRMTRTDGVAYALTDVAAFLLDAALAVEPHPKITAPAALRSVAAGFADYDPATPPKEHR